MILSIFLLLMYVRTLQPHLVTVAWASYFLPKVHGQRRLPARHVQHSLNPDVLLNT